MILGRRAAVGLMVLVSGAAVLTACASVRVPDRAHALGHGASSALDERSGHGVIDRIHVPTASGAVSLYAHYDPTRLDAPWVLYVHGGYWWAGNAGGNDAWSERLRVRGYQVFSVDYRLSQVARWPGPLDDVEDAIDFLRDHASTYGLDPSRGDLVGFSAGGQLATVAGLEEDVAGIVDLDGAVDPVAALTAPNKALGRAARQLLGCAPSACPGEWQDARTVTHIDATSPPMLIIHSIDDPTVPFSQALDLTQALRRAGRPVQLFVVPGHRHQTIGLPAVADQVTGFLDRTTARRAG